MHPVYILAFVTFAAVIGFLIWTRVSTVRHKFGVKPTGVGGVNDPMAGATDALRDPEAMRASLDTAADKKL